MAYYNLARDKFGRVIFNIHVRMNSKEGYVLEDIKKYTIFQMELGRRMIYPGAEMVTILFDMTDFAARHMDLGFVQFLVMALERYYPESLGVCLVYNAPWIFSPFWSMIKPWLDEVVAAKVQFAKGEELFKWVDKENLPKILGGNVEDPKHPVDSAVAYKSLVDEGMHAFAKENINLKQATKKQALRSAARSNHQAFPMTFTASHSPRLRRPQLPLRPQLPRLSSPPRSKCTCLKCQ